MVSTNSTVSHGSPTHLKSSEVITEEQRIDLAFMAMGMVPYDLNTGEVFTLDTIHLPSNAGRLIVWDFGKFSGESSVMYLK